MRWICSLSTCPDFLVAEELVDVGLQFLKAFGANLELSAEVLDKLGEANRIFIEDGDVAGGLIGDVDLVSLVDQSNQRAAHGNHVVVRMG